MGFYDVIDWRCDCCEADLNRQEGFSTVSGSWECSRCGYLNDVTEDNILSDASYYYETICPKCGGHMARSGCSSCEWECEDCGCYAKENDYGGLDCEDDKDDEEDGADDEERLSVYDAALIWLSYGKDEDYTFGYTEDELEEAL